MNAKKISIIIPVYNEINTLETLLDKVEKASFCSLEKEIIMVDDGSTDGTRDLLKKIAQEKNYKIYFHAKNMGKGAAIRTALSYVTGDIVVIQDADLEYDPNDYETLIRLLIEDKADVVYGSRFLKNKPNKTFTLTHFLGNKLLTFITNLLYGTTLTDMETCYKAFRYDVIKNITVKSNKFDFEPEITAKVLKRKHYLVETSISYFGRAHDEGKKITWRDGFAAISALIRFRFIN